MKRWEQIREARFDLTDYVIHFTKYRSSLILTPVEALTFVSAKDVLVEILNTGAILPTFARMGNQYSSTPRATVKGPDPAVCLTEQPLWAVAATRQISNRYSGYGIAYHKRLLYEYGGLPVLYAPDRLFGTRIKPGEPGYVEGCDIFRDGIPQHLQYLCVNYKPEYPGSSTNPIDHTWEREWRIKPGPQGLPVAIEHYVSGLAGGALVVEKDADVPAFAQHLLQLLDAGYRYPTFIGKIISLEAVAAHWQKDARYTRIETYPE